MKKSNKILTFYCKLMAKNRAFHDRIKHHLCQRYNVTLDDIDDQIDKLQ